MDIRSVDGTTPGGGTGSDDRLDALLAAKAPSAGVDAIVAGSVGAGAEGRGSTDGASVGASVGDDAAATDGIVARTGRVPRSTSAQATMTAVTSMGTKTRGIVGRSMRGYRGSVPSPSGDSSASDAFWHHIAHDPRPDRHRTASAWAQSKG